MPLDLTYFRGQVKWHTKDIPTRRRMCKQHQPRWSKTKETFKPTGGHHHTQAKVETSGQGKHKVHMTTFKSSVEYGKLHQRGLGAGATQTWPNQNFNPLKRIPNLMMAAGRNIRTRLACRDIAKEDYTTVLKRDILQTQLGIVHRKSLYLCVCTVVIHCE